MPRTTALLVGGIVELDDAILVDPFIDAANTLVTAVCGAAIDPSTKLLYTDERLEMIERWLTAHFYRIRDQGFDMVRIKDLWFRYQYKVDLGLNQTIYGQQAMLLDTAGGLARLNKEAQTGKLGRRVSLTWLGSDCE